MNKRSSGDSVEMAFDVTFPTRARGICLFLCAPPSHIGYPNNHQLVSEFIVAE